MRWLMLAAVVLVLQMAVPAGVRSTQECNAAVSWIGGCSTNTNGSSLDISGTQVPSDNDSPDARNSDSPSSPSSSYDADGCLITTDEDGRCIRARIRANPDGTPAPSVTMTDLAQFAPPAADFAVEPGNAGIAGMPTNLLGAASVRTQTGTLFGNPISVRFTPIAYDYSYGDGSTATVTVPGRTWEELGQAPFTPTPTSHVYSARGTYTAALSIRYSAQVDLGGWFPVIGELTTDSPSQQIRIFEAHTALVARTCLENPAAVGC